MKNEKEKSQSNPIDKAIDKAVDWSKSKVNDVRKRIEKSKTTRTKDRRLPILYAALMPAVALNVKHPRMLDPRTLDSQK